MRDIVGDRIVSAEQYLLLWLGLVGAAVDLHVPSKLLLGNDRN